MRRFTIGALFNRSGRKSRQMLAVGMLAFSLVMGVGATAKQAGADAATPYTVEVSWERVRWSMLDDCPQFFDRCDTAEAYGNLQVAHNGAFTSVTHNRILGGGGVGVCVSGWSGSGSCNKDVVQGATYFFRDTQLSNQAAGAYRFNNNKMLLTVRPGDAIRLSVQLRDDDTASGDDLICSTFKDLRFTEAQLQTLNFAPTLSSTNPAGNCQVVATMRRI
jgi:hypothetical protein